MVYDDVETFCRLNFRQNARRKYIYDKHKKYIRVGAGFDIETTRKDTFAFMYVWQVSFGDDTLIGRTWFAFDLFMQRLQQYLLHINARIIIWVANLGHEFSFLGRRYHWTKVFARESHQPLIAQTDRVEFRECLTVSGQGGLKNLAKNYTKTQKAVGDLDYTIPRNSQTPLDPEKEMHYIICDVRILAEWGEYIFTEYSDKGKQIPMTSTGIVRNMIKSAAADTGHLPDIKEAIKSMYPCRETYNFIMRFLFRGGYTHSSAWWTMIVWDGIIGADFTSSYPSVMLSTSVGYPKSEFIPIDLETDGEKITDSRMQTNCIWFVAVFRGIEKTTMHTIESEHKIMNYEGASFDNGRLISADMIRVALTEIDYKIYTMFYAWESIEIQQAYSAVRGRLPEYVLKPLRQAYQTKARIKKECKAKGITPDDIPEYRNAKSTINSYYGVMVQRLNFTEWRYDEITGEWSQTASAKTYNQMIANAILLPYWGIYVTAAARYALLSTVAALDPGSSCNNVLYCDTDSVYMLDTPRNRGIIAAYNAVKSEENKLLPPEFYDIGCFDWIGGTDDAGNPQQYTFKTLGAKRYIKYHDGTAEIVVAGMRKGTYEKAICRQFATENSYTLYADKKNKTGKIGYIDIDELFDKFTDSFCLSCDESEKNAAVYEPADYEAEITDRYGNTEIMHEKCGVAIVPIPFSVRMDKIYIQLLHNIMEERRKPIWK